MKILLIAQLDPNMFPALHQLACAFARQGAEVHFLSTVEPAYKDTSTNGMKWIQIPRSHGISARLPWFRSNGPMLLRSFRDIDPDWIVSQNEYAIPMIAFRIFGKGRARNAAYFSDYHGNRKYISAIKWLAKHIDNYIDICDVRLKMRRDDWPGMRAMPFIIRQAPFRRNVERLEGHQGPPRVIFTGSRFVLGLSRDRLSRFLARLCENGLSIDWYLPGPDEARATARSLVSHPLFAVRDPVEKSRLMETLGQYDAGLHWAPMLEKDYDPDYFMSAASNKIGEYIAAGLVVAHAGNPGLAYLPEEVCAVFDPSDPETGADQLAAQLLDRTAVERKREAALRYHLDEMNFEAQAAPFIRYILEGAAQT